MSKRRELGEHIASLSDIGELMDAMKGLALVESRRIAGFIDAQRAVMTITSAALLEFLQDYPPPPPVIRGHEEVVCVIGSERGFCGDLNQRLVDATLEHIAAAQGPAHRVRVVLVGAQLIEAWPTDAAPAAVQLEGAGFADAVQTTLLDLAVALTDMLGETPRDFAPLLSVFHTLESGPTHRPLLPPPRQRRGASRRGHALQINLPPAQLYRQLLDQYLEASLSGALYEALLNENQQRQQHMEQARDRIEERLADLKRASNRARQEEITEEIEILLISDMATGPASLY